MTGLGYNEILGKVHFTIFFIGVNLTFFPMRAVYGLIKFYFAAMLAVDRYPSTANLLGHFFDIYFYVILE